MTAYKLIQQLQSMPQNAIVVAAGYEDGYDTIEKVLIKKVKERKDKEWYYGKYEDSTDSDAEEVIYLFADTMADVK